MFRAKVYGVAGFEREFALKRFHAQLLQRPGVAEQLKTAARRYASLDHPRIAPLAEYDLDRPDAFVAVEWIAGLDLGQLIDATFGQGRPLPAGAATALMSQTARAVGYAHGRGLAHLGLCPTNLICTRAGEVKVTDFGFLPPRLVARPETDETLAGRLAYLAPEQLDGKSTSPATDVFALGTIFFELLTGRRAFRGPSAAEIAAAIRAGAPGIDDLPKPLARVLVRCFASSPMARYPGAGAFADAIDAAARGMLMRGDQRDAARSVAGALDHLAAMRADQVSGALSFPIPRPPTGTRPAVAEPSPADLGVPNLELDSRVHDDVVTDVRPPTPPVVAPGPEPTPTPTPGPAFDLEEHDSKTTPFVRERFVDLPEPLIESNLEPRRSRTSSFGESYLQHARPSPIGRTIMAILGLFALGAIGFFGYLILFTEPPGKAAASAPKPEAAAAVDAAPTAVDAAAPDAPIPEKLTISSTPKGATVYIDGTQIGQTPITVDGTADRHKLAIILPGHELHVAEIPGGGDVDVTLAEVTPSAGRAGIKVRCRKKNRYYVIIDGRDTGMLCPTERIGVTKDDHVVEIYDPITDTRSRFDVEITQTRRSTRVRVD